MPATHDNRRFAKLAISTTERERLAIERAVEHWQMRRGLSVKVNQDIRGEGVASICAEWLAAEVEAMRGA